MVKSLRNIAIIAHVDHGKTTLLDKLLQQSGMLCKNTNKIERIMDNNDLEKEKGITIISKITSINWYNHRINIIDTPGHSDFGGEVERILSMVDSVLLLIDAIDGPMPQTCFVTKKALSYKLKPIVVINKIDRVNEKPYWVINKIFDLFINLGASEEQLEFPIVYTSAIKGIAGFKYNNMSNNMTPLFDTILKNVLVPKLDTNGLFQMQISQIEYDNYIGVIGTGKINKGSVKPNQNVIIVDNEGKCKSGKIGKILGYKGINRHELNFAIAGDIVSLTGLNEIKISDTICDPSKIEALTPLIVDEPTVSISIGVNNSPFCGREGKYITSSQILKRLNRELLNDIALRVEKKSSDIFYVSGRGELHLSVLLENMRREGFELSISRPKVIFRKIDGIKKEPFELVVLNIEKKHQGLIINLMNSRNGEMCDIKSDNKGRLYIEYIIPSRGLIGFRTDFLTMTSGTGLLYSSFSHYDKIVSKKICNRKNGVLISNGQGKTVAYALYNLQERGRLFLGHGIEVYEGQIIGINNRSNDLTVNCLTGKKLTNIRASGNDEAVTLTPYINMSLEKSLEFINDDELIEVTPKSIRLRKICLNAKARKKIIK